jgi:hypothetical protein
MIMLQLYFNLIINSSIKKKREDSESKPRTRVNYSIDENNMSKKNRPSIPKKLNNTSTFEKKSEKTQASNLDDTLVYDESVKSPDISNICNEFFSPKSQRDPDKQYLNQTQIKQKNSLNEDRVNHHNLTANNYVNPKIERIFDTTTLTSGNDLGNNLEKANDFLRKLKKKKQEIKEREKKLLKEQEDLRVIKESKIIINLELRQRETLLQRENKKLEQQTQQLNTEKAEYEAQNLLKKQRLFRLEIEQMKSECQTNISEYDKDQFTLINSLINSFNFIENQSHEFHVIDNVSGGINNLSGKKKSLDFSSPYENKDRKLLKRYNFDHNSNVYKPIISRINNLNHINVIESNDFGYAKCKVCSNIVVNLDKKDITNISLIKEFTHLDASPDKCLEDFKLEDADANLGDWKSPQKIFYNPNHIKLPLNTSLNNDYNTSANLKKMNVFLLINASMKQIKFLIIQLQIRNLL